MEGDSSFPFFSLFEDVLGGCEQARYSWSGCTGMVLQFGLSLDRFCARERFRRAKNERFCSKTKICSNAFQAQECENLFTRPSSTRSQIDTQFLVS